MIDPNEKGVITRTLAVCRGSPKSFNISPQAFLKLSAKTIEALYKLEAYEVPSGVIERIKPKEPFNEMMDAQIEEVVNEFKKFMAIVVINHKTGRRVEMVSELVDEVWHTFILFTIEYKKFCDILVGEYIHHEPNVDSLYGIDPLFPYKKKQSTEYFYQEYERYFGALPKIWKMEKNSTSKVKPVQVNRKKQMFGIVCATAGYTASSILIPTFLILTFNENKFNALIETLMLEVVLIAASITAYAKIKDDATRKIITVCSILVGNIILVLGTIFLFICGNESAPYLIVIFFLEVVHIVSAFTQKTSSTNVGRGAGPLVIDGDGSTSGGGCGGGGCGGGGC